MSYYSVIGVPTLVCGGTTQWAGALPYDAAGITYRYTIMGMLAEPSAFKLTVNSVDFTRPTGSIDLDIEVMEGGVNVDNLFLRVAVTEDDVPHESDVYQDVTRDILNDVAISVSDSGEVQNVSRTFPVDPLWVTENMEIIAFIQDDTDRKVHAAVSTRPGPDYSLRYYASGELQHVGPSSGAYAFDDFAIYNLGNLTDTYTVDLTGDYPAGWFAEICDDTACHGSTHSIELAPDEFKELHLQVHVGSTGYASLTVEMSQSMVVHDPPRVVKYNYITDDVDVLIVDDDGPELYEDYLIDALSFNGYSIGVWDRVTRSPDASTLNNFPAVVWSVGRQFPTVDAADRAALSGFLDAGGSLLLTGQYIGWELDIHGGAGYQWYQDYLHAVYVGYYSGAPTLEGVPGDPVSHGIDLVIQGGDGANNQESGEDIDPADASASIIWTYNASANGAIRADTGTYKVIYLSFGFEAINNADDRRDVIQRSMAWLLSTAAPAGRVEPDTPLLIEKAGPGRLILSWGPSCLASDVSYELYQGTLGEFDTHTPLFCDLVDSERLILQGPGDIYYLIVPASLDAEGSYGRSSDGVERPQGTSACRPQIVGECSE